MPLIRITNGFEKLADMKLFGRSNEITTAMDGNTNFPSPVPALTLVTAAANLFKEWVDKSASGDRYAILVKNEKREELIDLLHKLGYYVLFTASGNRVKAASSGFSIAKNPEPAYITNPVGMKAERGSNPGTLVTSVDPVKNAKSYMHQFTTDATLAENNWNSFTSTSSKFEISGLTKGTTYYCRICVVGTKGQVMYSTVVSCVVL